MSKKLPAAYAWLNEVEGLPRMVSEALKLYGTLEQPGKGNNPVIMGWAREVGLERMYSADSVPWCGLFMAVVAKRAAKPIPDRPLWAMHWRRFGEPSPTPGLGDVLVFHRAGGGGHVGLYVGEDSRAYHVLGGNTRDDVSIARLARERFAAARRPAYRNAPAGVRPYQLAQDGDLSVNEE